MKNSMKNTMRELLLTRHHATAPKLDAIRGRIVAELRSKKKAKPGLQHSWLGLRSPRILAFGGLVTFLAVLFFKPLSDLIAFASKSDLYSHIFLVPAVTAYLLWLMKDRIRGEFRASVPAASILGALGLVALAIYLHLWRRGIALSQADYLAATGFAFVCLLLSVVALCFGARVLREGSFAFAFLVFAFPLPTIATRGLTVFLQYTSADVAYSFISWTGTTISRQGLVFSMPRDTPTVDGDEVLAIEVAEECSGIHSTFVLFITSLIAGYLFLKSPWKRALFTLAIIPLGIARNAFRILTISWLTVHVDARIIDSPLHRQGGPLFFVLSLIPLFAFLIWLRRSERGAKQVRPVSQSN